MNEFTKEELKWIATSITEFDFDSVSGKGHQELTHALKKVLSMIDNYCKHKSDGESYFAKDPITGKGTEKSFICKLCGASYK